ncbi:MAG: hypothetical protein ILP02_00040, partial [Clostridia bacterium]|nr:hypothetical protein [Clostridia bacterium]
DSSVTGDTSNSASASADQSGTSSEGDVVVVTGVNPSTDMLTYKANKEEKTAADKENEFFDRERDLFVGDDNAFVVKPSVAFRIFRAGSDKPEAYAPETWDYTINVYVKNGNNYVLLEGQDVTTYIEAVDNTAATVDFTAEAVGHNFKIEVYPDGLTAKQLTDDDYKVSTEVYVVDGYNVYTAKELAYVENGGMYNRGDSADYNAAWATFKEENGLTAATPASVILQTNVSLTVDDIPGIYFWSDKEVSQSDADAQKAIGSLKDYNYVYFRNLTGDAAFTFEGNYFTLDCRTLPLIVRPNDNITGPDDTFESHSSLFFFGSQDVEPSKRAATISDVNFIGNSPRVEDTSKSGGVILVKAANSGFKAYNNISNSFVINYFAESNKLNVTLEKCKGYDSFTTLLYVWGSTDVNIVDSEFIGAGGPVMIVDHVGVTDPDGGTPSCVKVKNSQLHSYITGQEAWFNMYNASSIVSQIVMMNAGFTPFGRSFVKTRTTGDGALNFIDFVA